MNRPSETLSKKRQSQLTEARPPERSTLDDRGMDDRILRWLVLAISSSGICDKPWDPKERGKTDRVFRLETLHNANMSPEKCDSDI